MITILTSATGLAQLILSVSIFIQSAAAGTPRIRCEIELATWCIAYFDGTVSLIDNGSQRIWSLQGRESMRHGPLVIVENKICAGQTPISPKLNRRTVVENWKHEKLNSVEFSLNSSGCTLEFRWPVSGQDDPTYERTMLYGILVGSNEKSGQLYNAPRGIRD